MHVHFKLLKGTWFILTDATAMLAEYLLMLQKLSWPFVIGQRHRFFDQQSFLSKDS